MRLIYIRIRDVAGDVTGPAEPTTPSMLLVRVALCNVAFKSDAVDDNASSASCWSNAVHPVATGRANLGTCYCAT